MKRRSLMKRQLISMALVIATLLVNTVMAEPTRSPRTSIAVGGFGLNAAFQAEFGDTPRGNLSAMLSTELENSGRFVVVERTGLSDVLSEQELTAAGLVRKESAAMPGELIGARLLVLGEITDFAQTEAGDIGSLGIGSSDLGLGLAPSSREGTVGLDIRVIDTSSGQLVSSFSVSRTVKSTSLGLRLVMDNASLAQHSFTDSPLGKALREAMSEAADRILSDTAAVKWNGRVIDFESGEVAINAGRRDGVQPGEEYQVFRITRVLRDPATGRILGERKRRIGSLTIVEVDDQFAFGRFSGDTRPEPNDLVTL